MDKSRVVRVSFLGAGYLDITRETREPRYIDGVRRGLLWKTRTYKVDETYSSDKMALLCQRLVDTGKARARLYDFGWGCSPIYR